MSTTEMPNRNNIPVARSRQRQNRAYSWQEMSLVRRYWASLIGSRPRPMDYCQIPSRGKHRRHS
jgi:hypothetical protein